MYHQGTVKGSTVRAVSLFALAGASLFGMAGTAAAASNAAASGGSSDPVSYSCSLAPYGQSLAPLSVTAALSAASSGSAVTVKLVIQPVQLPSATASALPGMNYLEVAGSAPTSGTSGSVSLSGQSQYQSMAAGSMTQLPAITASGTMSAAGAGMTSVEVPPTFTLTPVGSTAGTPMTCTTTSVTTVQVAVAGSSAVMGGTASATGMGSSGQPYTCQITVGTATTTSQVPMRLSASQSGMVGSQNAVTLGAPASAFGSAFPGDAAPMSVTGSAALSGMYTGSVPMTDLADSGNGMFQLTGYWMPRTAGQMRIFAPHRFTARLREQTTTMVMVTVACAAMSTTTTSTQVMVHVSKSSTGTAVASSASAAAAAAAGAPNTGGGGSLHPANDLPLAAGGAAAVVAGLGITGYALKRRRGGFNH